MLDRQYESARIRQIRSSCVLAAFLLKLAKHLALLVCFMIIGTASGRFAPTELTIFFMALAAAVLHSTGRSLEPRIALRERWSGRDHDCRTP